VVIGEGTKMAKRIKKPPVTPEQVSDWFARNERGESPPEIAKNDGYDVRTVRAHLQKVKQERERNEARATVLRNALEHHYEDLCNFALKLDPTNSSSTVIPQLPADDDIMRTALRQHIPRSPIWNLLVKKDKLEQEYSLLFKQGEEEIKQMVSAESRLEKLASGDPSEIIEGISLFLSSQFEKWAQGDDVIKGVEYLSVDPGGDRFRLQLGAVRLELFENKGEAEICLKTLRPVIDDLVKSIVNSPIFQDLSSNDSELRKTKQKLHEEISIIRMRRIVPGRCKFCPL
jgi:hypothetical protein